MNLDQMRLKHHYSKEKICLIEYSGWFGQTLRRSLLDLFENLIIYGINDRVVVV